MFSNTFKHFVFINSGHIELILILGILEFSSKYSNNSANLESQILFVESSHQADKFTQVSTTSFPHISSNSRISSMISSTDLKK